MNAEPANPDRAHPEHTPAISVIVPVYNVERYLGECLDSLLVQTHDDFEILLVDDGSTDSSSLIIEQYVALHPGRFRAFAKTNGGLADARNFGIDRAHGRYLAFVDSDDTVAPDFLESLHSCATSTGADLVLCGIAFFTDDGAESFYPEPDPSVFGHSLAEEPRLLYRVDASACDKLYARELFASVRFPVGVAFEDLPAVHRILPLARRVQKVDRPLYRYRQHRAGSITHEGGGRFLDLVSALRAIDDTYAEDGLFSRYRAPLLRLHLTHLIAGRYPDFLPVVDAEVKREYLRAAFGLLDERFAGWRADPTVRELWPNALLRAISTSTALLEAFSRLPRRAYFAVLARTGAFDPAR